MTTPLTALLRDNYAAVAKDLLGPLVHVLNAGRTACGGDLDNFLIILVVALRTAEDRRIAGLRLEQVLSGEIQSYPSLTTNVRSIADSTGIPKETVRRKVAALLEAGWIERRDSGLGLTPEASRMLTGPREEIFELAVRSHQTVEQMADRSARDRAR
jgi:hypothetical protein